MSAGGFLSFAIIAVFSQNVVFSGAGGVDLIAQAAKKPARLACAALCVSLFSALGALPLIPLDRSVATPWSSYMPARGMLLAVFVTLWYLLLSRLLKKLPALEKLIDMPLWYCAFNGAVMATPLFFAERGVTELPAVLGACLGSGIGFALAVLLVGAGLRHANSPAIPKNLRGTPVLLIYIGLLSLAFSCFS